MMKRTLSLTMAVLLMALPLLADQEAGEELNWQCIAGGGGDRATNGTYVLSNTIGQVSVGPGGNGTYVLNLGYRQSFDESVALCGDVDASGSVNISDAVYLIGYIFGGNPAPDPLEIADVDCSGTVNMSDVVYLIAYIFGGGPAPCAACP